MSLLTLSAKLERVDQTTPWGFRMAGGTDFRAPLTIQRVNPGSLASKCGLQAGDAILRIGGSTTDGVRHKDAQDLILRSQNHLELTLERGPNAGYGGGGGGGPAGYQQTSTYQSATTTQQSYKPAPAPAPAPAYQGGGGSVPVAQNRQFNTPIGLYSKDNVMDALSGQTAHMAIKDQQRQQQQTTTQQSKQSATYQMVHTYDSPKDPSTYAPARPTATGPPAPPANYRPAASPQRSPAAPPAFRPAPAPVSPQAPAPWSPSGQQAPKPSPVRVGGGGGGRPTAMPARPTGARNPRLFKAGAAQRMKAGELVESKIPICNQCSTTIRGPFVLALNKSWCPDHFLCANPQCGIPLEGVGFVEENGALYCEKDFEQYFAPSCSKCSRPVVHECVNAMQKQWHPHCFLCTHCRQPIGSGEFHIEEGQPYCNKDWGEMFQTKCYGCEFPIEPGDRWVEALNQNWHTECFNCSVCQINLEGKPYVAKAGKPYCKTHGQTKRF